ncbi:flagellar biosynthesis protein FliQ [Oceanospirillum linum]|uniref:Flagellar biosynthetic protein FliQ n=1 Tax=Oceanospirillum linum TaxID=966 RepID=A0A1T1HFH3_OCELI|nr:flagellar biosynthesis protein FliQ [Oceanospirillum linum]OOV88566.1 flagellar biosynthetic protein FliQ [Oceanospirillum linum]SEF61101.1 flagellar biosynthetic protein FliQ [Oleiphilus messinensis]SMP07089.1 flagellar biosynthetic protein FliQ [Oceanospirillum linum]
MTPSVVVDILREAMFLIMLIVAVMVVPSLLVGLVISVFQAATQINEQTLSFLPRLFATLLAIVIAGPWMVRSLVEFATRLYANIPFLIG